MIKVQAEIPQGCYLGCYHSIGKLHLVSICTDGSLRASLAWSRDHQFLNHHCFMLFSWICSFPVCQRIIILGKKAHLNLGEYIPFPTRANKSGCFWGEINSAMLNVLRAKSLVPAQEYRKWVIRYVCTNPRVREARTRWDWQREACMRRPSTNPLSSPGAINILYNMFTLATELAVQAWHQWKLSFRIGLWY